MPISIASSADTQEARFVVEGDLTLDSFEELSCAVAQLPATNRRCTLDLSKTEDLDSTALAMLLQLRRRMGDRNIFLSIVKGSMVDETLISANFDLIFPIEAAEEVEV